MGKYNNKIKNTIKKLTKKINKLNYYYYVKNKHKVEDYVYDAILNKLKILENKHPKYNYKDSPNNIIGKNINFKLGVIKHKFKMLSLKNAFSKKDIINFDEKIKKKSKFKNIEYCCELKIDGVGVSIIYNNGILINASTRGDGYVGEDITKNIVKIKGLPIIIKSKKNIPKILEVRGEVFILKKDFNKINYFQKKNRKKIFSNPRNTASGILRKIKEKNYLIKYLKFYCYNISYIKKYYKVFYKHSEQIKQLKNWNFSICRFFYLYKGIKNSLEFYNRIEKIRKKIPFNIDGIVIKVNSLNLQEKLGYSSKFPKWAIAYKFTPKTKITKIKKIFFSVGRTGNITPIAVLNPLNFDGIVIKKATLHNINEIKKIKLMNNDFVYVSLISDIIPKIIKPVFNLRTKENSDIEIPELCPICNSVLIYSKNKKNLNCKNKLFCKVQIEGNISHFISKNAINIPKIGKKILGKLIEKRIITNIVDIYQINKEKLLKVVKEKTANNILESIKNSPKEISFYKFLYSLSIPTIGLIQSKKISKKIKDINILMNSNKCIINKKYNLSTNISKSLINFFKDKNNLNLIDKLINIKKYIKIKY
ncbi:MAG: NAD-dependent DNA ligase LigA [Enterobacteriaceae bacterium]